MTPHDLIEMLAGIVIMGAGWQLKKLSDAVSSLQIAMARCVTYDSLSKTAKELHDKANSHGERIARLEPR